MKTVPEGSGIVRSSTELNRIDLIHSKRVESKGEAAQIGGVDNQEIKAGDSEDHLTLCSFINQCNNQA